jgi:Tol biopolymer transport system component
MNLDGSSQQQLTIDAALDVDPEWSPDGTKIAFTSTRDGQADVYVMLANGSGQTRYTANAANDESPSWQAR